MPDKKIQTLEEMIQLFSELSLDSEGHYTFLVTNTLSKYIFAMTAGIPGTLITKTHLSSDWFTYQESTPIQNETSKRFLNDVLANKNNPQFVTNAQIASLLFVSDSTDINNYTPNADIIVLRAIQGIKNPKVQLKAITEAQKNDITWTKKTKTELLMLAANNPNATAYNIYALMHHMHETKQPYDALGMYDALYAKALSEFQTEAISPAPNTKKMEDLAGFVGYALYVMQKDNVLSFEQYTDINSKNAQTFDIKQAIIGKQKHFTDMGESATKELLKLKQQLADAQKQIAELTAAKQKQEKAQQDSDKKIQELEQELDAALNDNKTLKLTAGKVKVYKELLQNIFQESEQLGTGLLGKNGIAATKQAIDNAKKNM